MSLFLGWLWLGCATSTAPTDISPPPAPGPIDTENATCVDECKRQQMARAVAAEQIAEDCARQCDPKTENRLTLPQSNDPK